MVKLSQEANWVPQPMEDGVGATDPGPRNVLLDQQNPDILTPPRTDHGTIPNLKFPFSYAHMRLEKGGWAREVTVRELPIATTLAGVNMRRCRVPCVNCTGTSRPNGPSCSMVAPALRQSIRMGATS